jgi:hypothetical protein
MRYSGQVYKAAYEACLYFEQVVRNAVGKRNPHLHPLPRAMRERRPERSLDLWIVYLRDTRSLEIVTIWDARRGDPPVA